MGHGNSFLFSFFSSNLKERGNRESPTTTFQEAPSPTATTHCHHKSTTKEEWSCCCFESSLPLLLPSPQRGQSGLWPYGVAATIHTLEKEAITADCVRYSSLKLGFLTHTSTHWSCLRSCRWLHGLLGCFLMASLSTSLCCAYG